MRNVYSMHLWALWMIGLLALASGVSCADLSPVNFRILRAAPVMTEQAEVQAVVLDGTPLADFAWRCDQYGAYIDALRSSQE